MIAALAALLPGLSAVGAEIGMAVRSRWFMGIVGGLAMLAWTGVAYHEGRRGAAAACRADQMQRERDDARENARRLNRLIDAERRHRRELDFARADLDVRLQEFARAVPDVSPRSVACPDPDRWTARELDALRKLRRDTPARFGGAAADRRP